MNTVVARRGYILPFSLLALAILSAEWWIVHSLSFQRNPDLVSIGMTLDLVVVIPSLYYFLVLRPKKSSPLILIPVVAICMMAAGKLIPAGHQEYLVSLKRLTPVLELVVIGALAVRLRQFVSAYREAKASSVYFTDALFSGFQKALSDRIIFNVIFVEFFLVYFSFAGWFLKPPAVKQDQRQFTYHRKSGYAAILAMLMLILAVETVALHLIVLHWSVVAAWTLTVLSIYGALWLIGDYHAIRVHPIIVAPGTLHLRTGLRWRADIPLENIEEVRAGSPDHPKSSEYLRASILWPRSSIILKSPVEIHGLFGRRKTARRIGVSVDDPDALRSAIESLSQSR